MIEKFKNLPVDEDTIIYSTEIKKIDEYDVAYQKWSWEAIYGESIIFLNDDVQSLEREDVLELIKRADFVKFISTKTYKKGEVYTFVNFNFKAN